MLLILQNIQEYTIEMDVSDHLPFNNIQILALNYKSFDLGTNIQYSLPKTSWESKSQWYKLSNL